MAPKVSHFDTMLQDSVLRMCRANCFTAGDSGISAASQYFLNCMQDTNVS